MYTKVKQWLSNENANDDIEVVEKYKLILYKCYNNTAFQLLTLNNGSLN